VYHTNLQTKVIKSQLKPAALFVMQASQFKPIFAGWPVTRLAMPVDEGFIKLASDGKDTEPSKKHSVCLSSLSSLSFHRHSLSLPPLVIVISYHCT